MAIRSAGAQPQSPWPLSNAMHALASDLGTHGCAGRATEGADATRRETRGEEQLLVSIWGDYTEASALASLSSQGNGNLKFCKPA